MALSFLLRFSLPVHLRAESSLEAGTLLPGARQGERQGGDFQQPSISRLLLVDLGRPQETRVLGESCRAVTICM